MIKINLLGKKKNQNVPFQLDEKFAKLGVKPEDFETFRPFAIKLVIIAAGLYGASYVPEYLYKIDLDREQQKLQVLEDKKAALNKDLRERKEQRKEMDKLNKEEAELNRQLTAVQSLNRERSNGFKSLLSIVNDIPSKVWVTKIDYKNKKVQIDGASYDYFSINDFFKLVAEKTSNTEVNFKWMKAEAGSNFIAGVPQAAQRIKTFTIEYILKDTSEGEK